jgi:hypothetical protein
MARPTYAEPQSRALLDMDVKTQEGVARAALLLVVLAEQGSSADLLVLARLLVMRSWPAFLRRRTSATATAILRRQEVLALPSLELQLRRSSPWRLYASGHFYPCHRDWFDLQPSSLPVVVDDSDPHAASVLGLLSCHENGHVREAAVRALAARGEGLPWLLMRVNDWVSAVRLRATTAVVERLACEHAPALLECLPLVWRLRELTRLDHSELLARMVDVLTRLPDERLTEAMQHDDRGVRRAVMQLLAERGHAPLELLGRALDDVDLVVRLRAAKLVPSDATPEAEALRERLCRSHRSQLRVHGLERMAEVRSERLDHWLEQGLDDPKRAVRETAQYLIRKARGPIDLAARYRSKLTAGGLRPGLVLGLAETGTRDDWERLVDALEGPRDFAGAAIEGLKQLSADATRELRLMMVDDPRPGVSRDAARSVQGEIHASDEDVLREYLGSPLAHVRRQAMRLAVRLRWGCAGLLLLALEHEPVERTALVTALRRWARKIIIYQAEVTAEEAERLRGLLAMTTLLDPDERQRALLSLGCSDFTRA